MQIVVFILSIVGLFIIGMLAYMADKSRKSSFKKWGDMSEEDKAEFFKSYPFKTKKYGNSI